jgi:hypothetical protein
MIRLSKNYGILDISQPYRPPLSLTGTALLLSVAMFFLHYAEWQQYNQQIQSFWSTDHKSEYGHVTTDGVWIGDRIQWTECNMKKGN